MFVWGLLECLKVVINVMLLRDDVIWSEELRQGGPESDTYSILFEMHRQQMIHDRVGNRTRCR
jgi:hypothetical protein